MERAGCAQALWGPGGGLDDDDIAVLFTLGDGSKVWALGNVEAVAVARGNVDEKRAVGRGSGSYLASLHQVMTAVHLKPHSSKSRTFTLPAGDKKTVNEALRSAVAAAY